MTATSEETAQRVLLVHAHPDDETIGTGATMAYYVARGAGVTLITCTLGEEGEVLVPELAQLAADQADQLGGWRITELAGAMKPLGVTDHRFLGGPGRFRDSGMMGTPANEKPRAFWRAEKDPEVFAAAVTEAVKVIREVRPQVLVTYDPNGGYGHPDHIMAHRVTMAAYDAAADPNWPGVDAPAWQVSKLYWSVLPKSVLQQGIDALKAAGTNFFGVESVDDLPMGTPDSDVTTAIPASEFGEAKMDAMRAHATQITVDGPFFALSNSVGMQAMGIEYYQLVRGQVGELGESGHESDLFSGIE
ncbi:N-acetyl-1-D-myo-inositol-2-amino-2-deoxy-alpha-D-glucopyranoside deacetylase [Frankineae bacterium MT45]|nr:N-acetyl-1-D-myo-inositol-2-amino-2-deoxy-alpha-D-glucopyranoside deacetylase [Frankineae bacterium MT45]